MYADEYDIIWVGQIWGMTLWHTLFYTFVIHTIVERNDIFSSPIDFSNSLKEFDDHVVKYMNYYQDKDKV